MASYNLESYKTIGINPDIEGLLDKDNHSFNGVVFWLKEPDAEQQTDFWFKKCLYDAQAHDETDDPAVSKRQFSRYKEIFIKLLSYIFDTSKEERGKELCQCAYFNLRPDAGAAWRSDVCTAILEDKACVENRYQTIIDYCRRHIDKNARTIYFFADAKIVAALLKHSIIFDADQLRNNCGVRFTSGNTDTCKRCFRHQEDDFCVTIYEIHHPASPRYAFQEKESNV